MKIQKYKENYMFYYYYEDSETYDSIPHGLCFGFAIGYWYHYEKKGYWLRKK